MNEAGYTLYPLSKKKATTQDREQLMVASQPSPNQHPSLYVCQVVVQSA